MRAVIDGLMYDTAMAELVADYEPPYPRNDFNWFREELYRTKAGRWFLFASGNGNSPYAKLTVGGRTGGREIVPLGEMDALEWLEGPHEPNIEVIEKYFKDEIEEA
jgi:hypothetical protein